MPFIALLLTPFSHFFVGCLTRALLVQPVTRESRTHSLTSTRISSHPLFTSRVESSRPCERYKSLCFRRNEDRRATSLARSVAPLAMYSKFRSHQKVTTCINKCMLPRMMHTGGILNLSLERSEVATKCAPERYSTRPGSPVHRLPSFACLASLAVDDALPCPSIPTSDSRRSVCRALLPGKTSLFEF